jgi:hypothetical protein
METQPLNRLLPVISSRLQLLGLHAALPWSDWRLKSSTTTASPVRAGLQCCPLPLWPDFQL